MSSHCYDHLDSGIYKLKKNSYELNRDFLDKGYFGKWD